LLKNVLKYLLILSLLTGVPVYAKKRTIAPVQRNAILATNYVVQDIDTGEVLVEQGSNEVRSIASITKLMTAIVVLDARQNLNEFIKVTPIKGISSKLRSGSIARGDIMVLALMSSDNLAAKLLAVNYPGGEEAAIRAMNAKAQELNMSSSRFVDPTGLLNENVSTGQDLVKLIEAAEEYQYIKYASTSARMAVPVQGKKKTNYVDFHTTNHLVLNNPRIVLSKTGWIKMSGGCLVMAVHDGTRRLAVILLNSRNTHTRFRDAELLYGLQNGKNLRSTTR
jgi:D-alanyl-D-alanine endopeptidase (penicillin-binding protein 7)